MMNSKRLFLWTTLGLILILIVLSVYGAFIGAERARALFNTVPLAAYWVCFLIMLIGGGMLFKRLVRVPALLLNHAGSVLVLIGAMWGSTAGHALQREWLGRDVIPKGYLVLLNGQTDNRVYLGEARHVSHHGERFVIARPGERPFRYEDSDDLQALPFAVELKTFRIEHYSGKTLYIFHEQDRPEWALPVKTDAIYSLGPAHGTLRITRVFKNFKVALENGEKRVYDQPGPGSNPALEVELTAPNGNTTTDYAFGKNHFGHATDGALTMLYPGGPVRDYISNTHRNVVAGLRTRDLDIICHPELNQLFCSRVSRRRSSL